MIIVLLANVIQNNTIMMCVYTLDDMKVIVLLNVWSVIITLDWIALRY